jgi:hypothetical protein
MSITSVVPTNGDGKSTDDVEPVAFQLKRLDRITFEVPIVGTSPLIVNRWSEKAKAMMLAAQQSKARPKKDPKDPVACFEASRYRYEDGRDGFPATAFKAAIVHAGRLFDGVKMVLLKQTFYVIGQGTDQLVPLEYESIRMREDTPRNATGVADLRYRAEYTGWRTTLRVRTIVGQFDQASVMALVDAAGIGGVGEWRPASPKSATGTFGTFEVDASGEVSAYG